MGVFRLGIGMGLKLIGEHVKVTYVRLLWGEYRQAFVSIPHT